MVGNLLWVFRRDIFYQVMQVTFQVMEKFHMDECVAEDTDYTVITRRVKAYAATTGSGKTVPQIMLQGNWVKQWGFEAGCSVRVECFPNKLVILKE